MFYLKINRVRLHNTHANKLFPWSDKPVVNLVSFVTIQQKAGMSIDDWIKETDLTKKKAALDAIVDNNVMMIDIPDIVPQYNINASITFGDTGYLLFRSTDIPDDLSWIFLAIKNDSDRRAVWAQVRDTVKSSDATTLIGALSKIIKANPAVDLALAVAQFAAHQVASYLASKPDDVLGSSCQSFIRQRDYPYGERSRDGIPDTTGNMLIDYSLFAYNPPTVDPALK